LPTVAGADNHSFTMSGGREHALVRFGALAFAGTVALTCLPYPAQASLPVPYAIVGCISVGRFHSGGMVGPNLVSPEIRALEGRTIRIEGLLSPGDMFRSNAVFIVDDACRKDLHKRYFLCDPCQTLPGVGSPSRMLPSQGGTRVPLPAAAIKELNDYPRVMRREPAP